MSQRRLAPIAALLLLSSSAAFAKPAPAAVTAWKERLQTADTKLRAFDWRGGAVLATEVMREMRERISGGAAAGSLLGMALLFRAIGEAGLGYTAEAAWDFGAAQALFPEYQTVDLSPYGPAASVLTPWRYDGSTPADPVFKPVPGSSLAVTPPKKIKGQPPSFPQAKADACVYGPVVVRSVVNEAGRLEFPSLPSRADPVLALAAFDALRNWQFEPARFDGKPVKVFFTATFDFKLAVCPGTDLHSF